MNTLEALIWKQSTSVAFVAGGFAAFLISVVIWKRPLMADTFGLARRWLASILNGSSNKAEAGNHSNEEALDVAANLAASTVQSTAQMREPFAFRERLWNEPADLEYELEFGHYDAVQKEFKASGMEDLEWKTTWLDLQQEFLVLFDYRIWVETEWKKRHSLSKDFEFYKNPHQTVSEDLRGMKEEITSNNKRFGKDRADVARLQLVVETVAMRGRPQPVPGARRKPRAKHGGRFLTLDELLERAGHT